MSDELIPQETVETTETIVDTTPNSTEVVPDGPKVEVSASDEQKPAELQSENAKPEYDVEVLYAELVQSNTAKSSIDVTGLRRVRGGILVSYKNMPLFLPTSHLSLKANPSENELLSLIQKTFPVHIHELNEQDKTKVIVSRRRLLRSEHLDEFKIGQIVEGKVVSITDFGVFVNLGGVDGMVHVSAMSRQRVNHPSELIQKGDTVKAVVKEINRNTQRLSLSMKELEADPWTGAAQEFPVGTDHKGKVKSITDFGVYVELKPSIEGLVHISEMSWARRIKHPSELFKAGDDIVVRILDLSEDKHKVALGYKQTQPNPWETINQRFQVGQLVKGTIKEVINRGVVINIADDIDAFMPRGKMHPSLRNKTMPFQVGDAVDNVLVMDVVAENHSLILGMEGFDQGNPEKPAREPKQSRNSSHKESSVPEAKQEVSLGDLLSDEEKRKLFGDNSNS